MDIKEVLILWFINLLIEIQQAVVLEMKLHKISNQLRNHTNELLENFKKRRVYSSFKDNICGADLADMQLISRFNKGIRFLLCSIDIQSKYAWVIPLKYEKGVIIAYAFQKVLDDLKRKPNKIWVDKGSEFYNISMKLWLEKSDTELYSRHNERKSVVPE